jgi:hypothetical protein
VFLLRRDAETFSSSDNGGMELRLDLPRFQSMGEAFAYALSEYAEKEHPVYPGKEPAFIFRGENGMWPTTKPSIARVSGCLSAADVHTLAAISDWVAAHLHEEREELTRLQAAAQMHEVDPISWTKNRPFLDGEAG